MLGLIYFANCLIVLVIIICTTINSLSQELIYKGFVPEAITLEKYKGAFLPDLKDSIEILKKEIASHPKRPWLKFILGSLYFEEGSKKYNPLTKKYSKPDFTLLNQSEIKFKELLNSNKTNWFVYYYLAHIEIQKDKSFEAAVNYFKKSIESKKDEVRPYLKLYGLYLSKHQYEEGIKLLEEAKKYKSDEYGIYHNLAINYLYTGGYDKAIDNANKGLSIKNNPETHNILAMTYVKKGDYNTAVLEYNKLLDQTPDDIKAILGLYFVYKKKGDKKKAYDILKKANELYPQDAEIKQELDQYQKSR